MPRSRLRRAGSRWRVLVHSIDSTGEQSLSHHFASDAKFGGGSGNGPGQRMTELPRSEFDELVVGSWIHLEQMDSGRWWMNIGGVTVWVRADCDGRPLSVDVYGPGEYADAVEGVKYGGTALTDGSGDKVTDQ